MHAPHPAQGLRHVHVRTHARTALKWYVHPIVTRPRVVQNDDSPFLIADSARHVIPRVISATLGTVLLVDREVGTLYPLSRRLLFAFSPRP